MNFKPDYSYREDQNVPDFDDSHPVMVFDGVCVSCSGGAAKLIKWGKKGVFRFATAQSKLGYALGTHFWKICMRANFRSPKPAIFPM